jgi:amino acid transporter
MEMSAVHVNDVRDPQRDYPRAMLICIGLVMGISILASLALAILIPGSKISIVAGMMQGYELFANTFHMPWMSIVIGILLAIGTLTMASTWIGGPAKGVQVAAMDGDVPRFFQKVNKKDMPIRVMMIEGFFFSCISVSFLVMPSVSDSFWALIALTSELYMLMYAILFIAGIVMRYRYPRVYRSYRIPGPKNIGMWLVAGAGVIGAIGSFILTLIPPSGINVVGTGNYVVILLGAFAFVTFVPLIIFSVVQYRRRHDDSHRELVLVRHASHVPVQHVDEVKSIKK